MSRLTRLERDPRAMDRLADARRAFGAAMDACPHWDYESGGHGHACCHAVDDARAAYRAAREDAGYPRCAP